MRHRQRIRAVRSLQVAYQLATSVLLTAVIALHILSPAGKTPAERRTVCRPLCIGDCHTVSGAIFVGELPSFVPSDVCLQMRTREFQVGWVSQSAKQHYHGRHQCTLPTRVNQASAQGCCSSKAHPVVPHSPTTMALLHHQMQLQHGQAGGAWTLKHQRLY